MAAAVDGFHHWLDNKLKDLNTDEGVFGSYIIGILDSDETTEEKTEALQEILSEIVQTENDIAQIYNEIMEMWLRFKPTELPPANQSGEAVDVKLAKLLESQCLTTTKQKKYTEEEKKIREAILAQYSQMSDEEGEAPEPHAVAATSDHKENGLEKNTNAQAVQQAEKEKREQAKMESLKKKEKDKEDRDKQKQMREEKKDKRKTQKGERRR